MVSTNTIPNNDYLEGVWLWRISGGLLTGDDSETKKKYGENDKYMSHLVS